MRLRLKSTVVQAKHRGGIDSDAPIDVAYVEDGQLESVERGTSCSPAGIASSRTSPTTCRRRNDGAQRSGKVPLIYTNVLIRNWAALEKLGVRRFTRRHSSGTRLHRLSGVDRRYKFAEQPDDPVLLHMGAVPTQPDCRRASRRRRGAAGWRLSFEELERSIRDSSARARTGRLRSGARHRGDHRQSLVARLRLRIHAAVGRLLARRPAADRDGAQGVGAASPSRMPTPAPTPTPIRRSTRRRAR